MSDEPDPLPEEELTSWLAACDDALAAGGAPSFLDDTNIPPELRDRVERDLECLHLLDQLRPRPDQPSAAPPAAAPTPLQSLGRFQIRRQLGRGGFGVVFLAYDPQLGREVALKVPRVDVLIHPELRLRFYHEARAAAALDHPHIVQVYEAGEIDSVCFIASAYHPGVSLAAWLKQQSQPVPFPLAAELVATLAEAVQHAHSRGVLHRDLKPGNILLSSPHPPGPSLPQRGEGGAEDCSPSPSVGEGLGVGGLIPTIADFGLAKLLSGEDQGQTQTGDIVGTPCYMSPEQAAGKTREISTAVDVYGLGAILYELLTRRPPFLADTSLETVRRVVTEEPVPPGRLRPKAPRDLETICLKCLEKEPGKRYASAAALADDLRRFLAGEPVRARPVGSAERLVRWCRRKPAVAALAASVVLLLVALAAGSTVAALLLGAERDRAVAHLQRAEEAEGDAREKLWASYLAQAQARRWSGQPGRHFKSLAALRDAARIRPTHALRNEAAACFPLVDLQPVRYWTQQIRYLDQPIGVAFDARLARYAFSDARGAVTIRRVDDDSETVRLPGFGVGIFDLSFSSNGQFLVVRYRDTRVTVWDLKGVNPILQVAMPRGSSGYFAQVFSADSRRLLVGLGDRSLRIYDLPSKKEIRRFTLPAAVGHMALHPDGQRLAVCGWNQTALWVLDTDTGKVLTTLPHPQLVTSVAWHPRGKLLAVGCWDGKIHVWNAETGKEHDLLRSHQHVPMGIAFNQGGDLLATWAWDGTTRLWDPISARELVSIPGFFTRFSSDDRTLAYVRGWEVGLWEVATGRGCRTLVAFGEHGSGPGTVEIHPQGRLVVSSHDDGARLWDLAAGKKVAHIPVGRCGVAFDPRGESLIVNGNQGTQRWPITSDRKSGAIRLGPPKILRRPPALHYGEVCLSRDGRRLATVASYREAVVLDLKRKVISLRLGPHANLSNVALNPGERWAVTGTQFGSGIKVWDARSGKLIKDLPAGGYASGIFSGDGKYLLTTSKGEGTHLREAGSWKVRHHLTKERCSGMAISPDSSFLALSYQTGTIVLIDTATGQELVNLPAPNPLGIGPMSFSSDNGLLAAACSGHHRIQVWDLHTLRRQLAGLKLGWGPQLDPQPKNSAARKALRVHPVWDKREFLRLEGHQGIVNRVVFAPGGKTLASGSEDGTIKLWDRADGQLRKTLYGHTGGVLGVTYSPDGQTLVSTGRDHKVILWDAATGQKRRVLEDHTGGVETALFSPDGKLLATASFDGTVKVRTAQTGQVRFTLQHVHQAVNLTFSRDSKTLVSCGGYWNVPDDRGEVKVWDLATGKELLRVPGRFGGIWTVALSADGKTLAGACLDGTVRLWDAATGKARKVLRGHTDRVLWVAFSPTGKEVVSSGFDATIRLWDVATGQERDRLRGHIGFVHRCSFSPHSRVLASTGSDRTLRLWKFPLHE